MYNFGFSSVQHVSSPVTKEKVRIIPCTLPGPNAPTSWLCHVRTLDTTLAETTMCPSATCTKCSP